MNYLTMDRFGRYKGIGPKLLDQISRAILAEGLMLVPRNDAPLRQICDLLESHGMTVVAKLTQDQRNGNDPLPNKELSA